MRKMMNCNVMKSGKYTFTWGEDDPKVEKFRKLQREFLNLRLKLVKVQEEMDKAHLELIHEKK